MNTQKQIEKTNKDTSDNDTDEKITYETDELKSLTESILIQQRKRAKLQKYIL